MRRIESIKTLLRWLTNINEVIGKSLAWLTLGMVLLTFTIVVLRGIFNIGWIAMQESVSYMHAAVFMLGAAYTLKHEGHVRVDIFYRHFNARLKAVINLLGNLCLLMPVVIFILLVSLDYVGVAWRIQESSAEAGGLPFVYLLKTVIPAMAILLLIQASADSLRCGITLISDVNENDKQRSAS